MAEIEKLQSRVSEAQQRLTAGLGQGSGSAERMKDTLLRLESAFKRNKNELEKCKYELGRCEKEIDQHREESRHLASLLNHLLDTIENSGGDPLHEFLEDIENITGKLGDIIEDSEGGITQDGEAQEPVNLSALSNMPRRERGNGKLYRPKQPSKIAASQNKSSKNGGPGAPVEPAGSENRVTESLDTDELSLRAVAELWSHESGQSKITIRAELVAAFQDIFGKEAGDVNGDTTITREDLQKFCSDANITPPSFWNIPTDPD